MKVGERISIVASNGGTRRVKVIEIRGDYAYVEFPSIDPLGAPRVRAFHRRTGKPRRDYGAGWTLVAKHLDPQAGRGTTR
jgi:hypothetical protein